MKTQIFASLAVVGTVAALALFKDQIPSSTNFLQSNEHEAEFNNFIAKHRKSYGTKEEY